MLTLAECERAQQPARAMAHLRRAIALARRAGEAGRADLGMPLTLFGAMLFDAGRTSEARAALSEAIHLVRDDARAHLVALTRMGRIQAAEGEHAAAEATFVRAVELARTTEGDPRDSGRALLALAHAKWRDVAQRAEAQALRAEARRAFAAARPPDAAGLRDADSWPPK